MTIRVGATLLAAAVLAVAGCADERAAEPDVTKTVGGTEGVMQDRGAVTLGVTTQAPYGQYLVDAEDRALYMFTADEPGQQSTCYEACAQAWPPVVVDGDVRVTAETIQTDMIGTIQRRDGSMQLTYAGWPLYYYAPEQPGQVDGQGIDSFGGEWYLIGPSGEVIREEPQRTAAR